MSKYSSSDWKDCHCHNHGHDGHKGKCHCHGHDGHKGKCHCHGLDECKGNCHGQHGKCHCSGHHDNKCHCGGKGHCDDHHHCHHCKSVSCHGCRRFICDDDFRLRLGGLQNGLGFRLRQLIGCYAEFTLEDDKVVHGKICHVGSNFVEMMVEQPGPSENGPEENDEQEDQKKNEKDPYQKEKDKYPKKDNHTMIFSLEKINHLKHRCGCPGPCGCK